eukprot:COSAG02_NODE_2814_length_7971_cov_4.403455_4_plen_64_part_00
MARGSGVGAHARRPGSARIEYYEHALNIMRPGVGAPPWHIHHYISTLVVIDDATTGNSYRYIV